MAVNISHRSPANKRFHGLLIDMTGKRVGRWTVLALHPKRCGRKAVWWCRCECGTERGVIGKDLRRGRSTSCGCRRQEENASQRTAALKRGRIILGAQ
jgi:hypothetical protein